MNRSILNEFATIIAGDILLVVLIAINAQGIINPLAIVRFILGLGYVLIIPGYMLQKMLFPREVDLDSIERVALSLALSVAIIPPIALLLNWLPWGIRIWPIIVSLSVFIVVCMAGAVIRYRFTPPEEKVQTSNKINLRAWWAGLEKQNRLVLVILVGILAVASLTSISILVMPKPAEFFTEFYILGQEGLAEDYPREITAGQTVSITTGITNREGTSSTYNIKIMAGEEVIGQAGPIVLQDQATWEQPVEFSVPTAGADQQVTFLLEREGQQDPYRTLRIWVNVIAGP